LQEARKYKKEVARHTLLCCLQVYACEWNPNAVEALRKGLVANAVAHRCVRVCAYMSRGKGWVIGLFWMYSVQMVQSTLNT